MMPKGKHNRIKSEGTPETPRDVRNDNNNDVGNAESKNVAYFYDTTSKPTLTERIFGEPYHVHDDYPSHQITFRLVLCLMMESIVTGSILWLQIAIRYYLVEQWSVGPSQFVGILSVVQIPFTIRILYGLLIDSVSFFGYKRKSYLLLFGMIAVISSFGLTYYHYSFTIQIFCLCVRSFAIAFCDVIISAITVERSEYKSHSVAIRLQSLNYFSMYVVSAVGLIYAAKIEESQKPKDIVYVYWIYFFITFLIVIGAILLPEHKPKSVDAQSVQTQLSQHIDIHDRDTDNGSPSNLLSHKMLNHPNHHRQKHDRFGFSDSSDNDQNQRGKLKFDPNSHDEYVEADHDEDILNMLNNRIENIGRLENENDLRQNANDKNIMYDRPQYTISQILELTFESFCRKIIFYPLLFTFVMSSMPRSNQAMDYFLMYELNFDSNQIGYLQIVSSLAFLLSVIIITIQSRKKFDKFSLRHLFAIWTFIAAIIPYLSLVLIFRINLDFGVSDFLFVTISTLIYRITIAMLLLGTAVLYARICPPGIEGVFFTLLTSVATLGEVISYALSAFFINIFDIQCTKVLYNEFDGLVIRDPAAINADHGVPPQSDLICDFSNLWLLIIAVNLTTLVPLMWIFWIPNESEMKKIAKTLRKAAINRLSLSDDNDANYDNVLKRGPRQFIKEKEMISLYFIGKDYLFPCLKHCICACCIKMKDQEEYILNRADNDDDIDEEQEEDVKLTKSGNRHGYI